MPTIRSLFALVFIISVFFFFMQAGLFAGRRSRVRSALRVSRPHWSWFSLPTQRLSSNHGTYSEHPIPQLMADAEKKFKKMLSRQSKTLKHAVTEYRRRYGREPPKGFGDWWQFTQEHHVRLVDEFDPIHEDLSPFWNISGAEFRERAFEVAKIPSIDLVCVVDGRAGNASVDLSSGEHGKRAFGFLKLIEKFAHTLPDMYFPINAMAEGRILVPWEHRQFSDTTARNLSDMTTPDWNGQGSVWDGFRRSCPPETEARRLYSSIRNTNAGTPRSFFGPTRTPVNELTFVTAVEDSVDYCSNPSAHISQGHFFSDWRTIPVLYPVFSPAKAVGFLDIRIPSNYYLGLKDKYTYGFDPDNLGHPKEVDDMEVPWEEKRDIIFWRGADTGGGSTPPGFAPNFQRHRFLSMSHHDAPGNHIIVHADPSPNLRDWQFITTTVPARKLNSEIMDTAFVKTAGAYPGGATEVRKHYRFAPLVPLGEHWKYKYLIDLDGMGYSARFMAFLASESAVMKSSVWREYYADWLQPWLHYIPLSSSYAELYNIHAYFSGPTPSTLEAVMLNSDSNSTLIHALNESLGADHELQRIARAGRHWKRTIGRVEDMEAYVYRLCLEYARLWADDRDSMGFQL